MTRKIILIPIGKNKNLTSVVLSLSNLFKKKNKEFSFWSPFIDKSHINSFKKNSIFYLKKSNKSINFIKSVFLKDFSILFKKKNYSIYLEKLLDIYYNCNNKKTILIEGIQSFNYDSKFFFNQLNLDIARILNAEIIFVITSKNNFFKDLNYKFYIIKNFFIKNNFLKILGVIFNSDDNKFLNNINNVKELNFNNVNKINNFFKKNIFSYKKIPILGVVPSFKINFSIDRKIFMDFLCAKSLFESNLNLININLIILFSKNFTKISDFLNKNVLLIVSLKDLSYLKKIFLMKKKYEFSLLFVGKNKSCFLKHKIYKKIKKIGLSTFFTSINLSLLIYSLNIIHNLNKKICLNKNLVKKFCFSVYSTQINSLFSKKSNRNKIFSSYNFLYKLKKIAKSFTKTIIFPEGENKKIIKAVDLCYKFNICKCILVGNPNKIYENFLSLGLSFPKKIKIYDPKKISKEYITILKDIYSTLTIHECKKILKKNTIVLSMLILITNKKCHGLVAGIVNTTANVIRPALKIVKMNSNVRLISSIFFMLFPEKVLIYGDCAINPNPSALDLAEIAIQSSESAKIFGILPKIAMLSYSTNDSGSGPMVDKVKIATELVRKKRPDLIIEGPIQYDAATDKNISKIKFLKSKILGDANIFIFPDLNSGNISYKAVQRNCSIFSIGPMIQGLKKPVNDLSRGASVEDILYTIALTVLQSSNK
ncbi:MAG: phosphate acetyltransferase [Buchnera aphidicola (Periphyllus acericola)]|uniref:phosphate acetyltransferase n=1 Tax=Buchnera aphidicola TaxID=9 RepID=UPI0030D53B51|nr:phosphate acetyltransferase [Buchnera aphidicola (Periphyllus acericola)]